MNQRKRERGDSGVILTALSEDIDLFLDEQAQERVAPCPWDNPFRVGIGGRVVGYYEDAPSLCGLRATSGNIGLTT